MNEIVSECGELCVCGRRVRFIQTRKHNELNDRAQEIGGGGAERDHADDTVIPWMQLRDPGERPSVRRGELGAYKAEITDARRGLGLEPLGMRGESVHVFSRPSLPKMISH